MYWFLSYPVMTYFFQNNDDRSNQSGGGQKIPDGVLNAMSKPGQAKPFSYGIDLDELKLKTQWVINMIHYVQTAVV